MKKATFYEGTGIALISSIAVAALFMTLSSFFVAVELIQLLVAGLSLFYILYLFSRSRERVGRVTVIFIWFIVTLTSMVFLSSLLLYFIVQLVMIWLIRSLYFYSSLFSSFADLALTGLSLMVAFWAWSLSFSLFLSFWCFFLLQALFVYIPQNFTGKKKSRVENRTTDDDFERAYRAAEAAVRRLSTYY